MVLIKEINNNYPEWNPRCLILTWLGGFRWIKSNSGTPDSRVKTNSKKIFIFRDYTRKNRDAEGNCPILDEETGAFTIGLFVDWTII